MGAGSSQAVNGVGAMLRSVELEKDLARRSRAGCVGEQAVCQALAATALDGVHHFDDRRLAGDPDGRANLDHVVVAPSGVYVVDAKNWKGRIEVRGHAILQDGVARTERLVALAYLRNRVEELVATTSAAAVRPQSVVCFAGTKPGLPPVLDGMLLTDVTSVGELIRRRPRLLTNEQVTELVDLFRYALPPYVRDGERAAEAEGLLFPDSVTRHAALNEAVTRPIEEWMVWLHPEQAAAVRRTFDGPARIRGVAGTGKTVVGLHRVAWLASIRPGRFLVTSYVNTLPQTLEHAYRRLSAATADRVDFRTVHKVALDLLAQRGRPVRLDSGNAAFNAAWRRAGTAAEQRGLTKEYVQEEIAYVVKGRGIDTLEEYAGVDRPGRGGRLGSEQRRAVWGVATAYDEELAERGVCDFVGVLRLARDVAREEPCRAWSAVMVDEVQDVPLVALQLLHALAGDRRDGLLLIGDGQQAIYPGGFRLAEAGIDLRNRAVVLRTNYRNTVEILATARNVGVEDTFDGAADADGVEVVRHGEVPMDLTFESAEKHDAALVYDLGQLLDTGVRARGIAVLCPTNAMVETYVARLTAAGIPATAVTKRSGIVTTDSVSVATWHRSKGLEFAHVFVARVERATDPSDDPERLARERRTLYVAMTRARDTLWVGRVVRPLAQA